MVNKGQRGNGINASRKNPFLFQLSKNGMKWQKLNWMRMAWVEAGHGIMGHWAFKRRREDFLSFPLVLPPHFHPQQSIHSFIALFWLCADF
jgi:hypothetical protein